MAKITKEEIQIKKMAFSIIGLHMDESALEAFELVSEIYKRKKGKFNLKDACGIKAKLFEKYGNRRMFYSMDLMAVNNGRYESWR